MLSSRKSMVDLSSVKRNDTMSHSLSARKNPLSSRGSMMNLHMSPQKRKVGKRLWRVGSACVRAIIRMRKLVSLPKLTMDEVRDISAKFFDVMCLNSHASISEFLASLGVHFGEEDARLLPEVRFVEGRALTLYQVLRLTTFLKRQHRASIGSDTAEAFSALAVNGSISSEAFRQTLMKFDLRVQFQDAPDSLPSSSSPQIGDEDGTSSPTGVKSSRGEIDLARFSGMLNDAEEKTKLDYAKRRFSRFSTVQHEVSLQHTIEASSGVHSPELQHGSPTDTSAPRPLEAVLAFVRQSMEAESQPDYLKKEAARSEKSPLRSEVFPFRMNKKRWDFNDVVQRIDEIEKRGDVHRPLASHNARYCSDSHRPPLALLTPFTDLAKSCSTSQPMSAGVQSRLLVPPRRGLPAALAAGHPRRCTSVPLVERFPVLAKRRERLHDALPRRDFTDNGRVGWSLSPEQRVELAQRRQVPRYTDDDGNGKLLKYMASATLQSIKSH